jgi:hypothetical protein
MNLGILLLLCETRRTSSPTLTSATIHPYLLVVGLPVELLLTGPVYGITGPLSLLLFVPWILAIGTMLIIKPIWEPRSPPVDQPR